MPHCVRRPACIPVLFLSMIPTEALSDLLNTLYAAPLQHEKWQTFFDHLSRLTKISSGYLLTGGQSQEVLAGGGSCFNPEVVRLYNEHYGPFDPFREPFLREPQIRVVEGDELVSHDQLRKTGFYNDLLAKNEMEYMTMLSCSTIKGEQMDVMPIWRRAQDGPMDNDSLALLRMILPHAHTALQIRTRLKTASIQDQFAETALDTMSIAAFHVAANGHVHHMNSLAAALVQAADGLRLEGSRLTATLPAERAQLESLITAASSPKEKRSPAPPGGALNISRHTQRPLHLSVLSVPEARRLTTGIPCALVFATDPGAIPRSRAAFMRMLYRLTPAESRVADLLLEGRDVRTVAATLGITLETARFHLKRVLARTGTRRQTELMRLMLSLPGQ